MGGAPAAQECLGATESNASQKGGCYELRAGRVAIAKIPIENVRLSAASPGCNQKRPAGRLSVSLLQSKRSQHSQLNVHLSISLFLSEELHNSDRKTNSNVHLDSPKPTPGSEASGLHKFGSGKIV